MQTVWTLKEGDFEHTVSERNRFFLCLEKIYIFCFNDAWKTASKQTKFDISNGDVGTLFLNLTRTEQAEHKTEKAKEMLSFNINVVLQIRTIPTFVLAIGFVVPVMIKTPRTSSHHISPPKSFVSSVFSNTPVLVSPLQTKSKHLDRAECWKLVLTELRS